LVSSTELTQMYLARLKRYQPTLNFYVTLTEELALHRPPKPTAKSRPASTADRCTAAVGRQGSLCDQGHSHDLGR
jgi:Asp-tRNA(Asn)/Glu-tRNA(Gln) amidotransferase A subunit family amidase